MIVQTKITLVVRANDVTWRSYVLLTNTPVSRVISAGSPVSSGESEEDEDENEDESLWNRYD